MPSRKVGAAWLSLPCLLAACGGTCPTPAHQAAATEPAAASSAAGAEPERDRVLGTAHPYTLLTVDPEARYVVMCQARKDTDGDGQIRVGHLRHGERVGDDLQAYFVERGAGEPIDAFLGRSGAGRYVAFLRGGKLVLLDVVQHRSVSLDTGLPAQPQATPLPPPLVSFGFDERFVVYQRQKKTGPVAVLRDLLSHEERELLEVPGLVWYATLTADEEWVELYSVTRDTDKNGKVELPAVATNLEADACGSALSYSTYGVDGDQSDRWLVPTAGGKPQRADDLVMPLGKRLLRRAPDGALWLDEGGDKRSQVAPASCGGVVLDANQRAVLVACPGTPAERAERTQRSLECLQQATQRGGPKAEDCLASDRSPLFAWTGSALRPLDIEVDRSQDTESATPYRFFPISAYHQGSAAAPAGPVLSLGPNTSDEFLYDTETYQLRALEHGHRVVALAETHYLEANEKNLSAVNLLSGESRAIGRTEGDVSLSGTGRFMFLRPLEIDLEQGSKVGEYAGQALAIASDGRLLVEGEEPEQSETSPASDYIDFLRRHGEHGYRVAPFGPLRWISVTGRR
jgi:hypothetical protein